MTTAPTVRHPIFSRLYGWCAAKAEKVGVAEHRDELLAGTSGRVIEVGAGNGLNFAHYPNNVTQVVALEPEAHLRRLAEQAASRARVPIRVEEGTADHLPSPDGAFDVGVASLVLCSVPDQAVALAELHRVIRPGGELRFYEHVRSTSPRRARLQDRADLIWPVFGGGCHPNRDTEAAISAAGFEIQECRQFDFQPCFFCAPSAPNILGRGRRP